MARTVGANKAETHERILRAAAKALRRDGYEKITVADVMKAAGLTHGGFYSHFASREAMLAEALDWASTEAVESLVGRAVVKGGDPLENFVGDYLSDRHMQSTEAGCTLAALGTETRRQSSEIRGVATKRLKQLVKMIEVQSADHPDAGEPLAALATLVGALVIARVVDEPELAKDVRAAATRAVLGKKKKR